MRQFKQALKALSTAMEWVARKLKLAIPNIIHILDVFVLEKSHEGYAAML